MFPEETKEGDKRMEISILSLENGRSTMRITFTIYDNLRSEATMRLDVFRLTMTLGKV